MVTAGVTDVATETVIEFDCAVVEVAQAAFDVNTQLTISPLLSAEVVYEVPVATGCPSTSH